MGKDIINSEAYIKLVEDTVDKILHLPRDNRGSHNTTSLDIYVKYVLFKLISGCSWEDFNALPNMPYTGDAIRKKFNKWTDAGIFDAQFYDLVNIYLENKKIKELFMDSFDVLNSKGTLKDTSYGHKFKNKNALRTNVIITEELIPLAVDLYPANINDNQRIEHIVKQLPSSLNATYNQPVKIISDLGYLINKKRNQKLRTEYNATIVTSKRKNMKKKRITKENKKLLKKRICVEHFHAKIKGKFKQLNSVTDKTKLRIRRWIVISFSFLLFEHIEKL
jgi:transposase